MTKDRDIRMANWYMKKSSSPHKLKKCKLKQYWDIISWQREWNVLTILEVASVLWLSQEPQNSDKKKSKAKQKTWVSTLWGVWPWNYVNEKTSLAVVNNRTSINKKYWRIETSAPNTVFNVNFQHLLYFFLFCPLRRVERKISAIL